VAHSLWVRFNTRYLRIGFKWDSKNGPMSNSARPTLDS